ncbi:hypothetical protein ACIOG3_19110 [Yersinia rochesterensis]
MSRRSDGLYLLHHKKYISNGGGIYNVDNISATTAKDI